MGINVQRETEHGDVLDEVLDPHSLLVRLVENETNDGICLRFVDPYGDTTFNQAQITVLIKEIQAAIERSSDESVRVHARKVLDLVQKAEGEPHTYVKFVGD